MWHFRSPDDIIKQRSARQWLGHSNYAITANLYSHLEYNAKVISAETIARVLDGETEQKSKAPAEAEKKSVSKTTDKPAPKKSGGRKKKSDIPVVTGETQM